MTISDLSFTLFDVVGVLVFGYVIGRTHAAWRDPRRAEERRKQNHEEQRTADERLRALAPELRARVELLLAEGRILEAVRDVRDGLSCGLKEAKDVVDLARDARGGGARAP
jgi:ribosomal protein L7/L12